MIFAMHQIMVAILVRHGMDSAWHRELMRQLLDEQLLIASSTTEGQGGGDLRTSVCAVERSGDRFTLTKDATVMSYGAQADAILTTARRSADAPPTDQVLVATASSAIISSSRFRIGRRSGCAGPAALASCSKAAAAAEQVLPEAYAAIQMHTMMPVAHLTWSSVWAGIAAGAVERARRFVRIAARRSGGQLPPGAAHLTRAGLSLRSLRGTIASALRRFEAAGTGSDQLELMDFQNAMNLLKVNASEIRHGHCDELHACLRIGRLSQRRRIQRGAPSARHSLVVHHDQQRSHPRQRGRRVAADRAAINFARLAHAPVSFNNPEYPFHIWIGEDRNTYE